MLRANHIHTFMSGITDHTGKVGMAFVFNFLYCKLARQTHQIILAVGYGRPCLRLYTSRSFDGSCSGDPATEQYLEIEAFDFHDHPMFTLRWRYDTV